MSNSNRNQLMRNIDRKWKRYFKKYWTQSKIAINLGTLVRRKRAKLNPNRAIASYQTSRLCHNNRTVNLQNKR